MIRTTYSLSRSKIFKLLTTNYGSFDQGLIKVGDFLVKKRNDFAWKGLSL